MTAPALALDNVSAWYGAAQVLFDVSLTVGRGEVVALMGRNGAGKSGRRREGLAPLQPRSG